MDTTWKSHTYGSSFRAVYYKVDKCLTTKLWHARYLMLILLFSLPAWMEEIWWRLLPECWKPGLQGWGRHLQDAGGRDIWTHQQGGSILGYVSFWVCWTEYQLKCQILPPLSLAILVNQYCGSMTFWYKSWSTDRSLWLKNPDPDPDLYLDLNPAIFIITLQDANN
jgi:hypothetical protein